MLFARLALILALVLPAMGALPTPARAQMDARDMEICRQGCMARARDASDPRFKSCVASRCQGQAVRRSTTRTQKRSTAPAAAAPAAAAAAGALAVGAFGLASHPAMGAGVLTQTDDGVLGLACTPDGVAIRASNGMFRSPTLGWITDTGSAGGSITLQPGAVYSETTGSACALGVPGLASAVSLVLIDAPVTRAPAGPGFVLGFPGGADVPVGSGSELLARFPGARVVPAQGIGAGLGALAASCPALADALRSPCP